MKQFIESTTSADEVITTLRRLYSERIIHWIPSVELEPTTTSLGEELQPWLKKADFHKAVQEVGHLPLAASVFARFGFPIEEIPRRIQSVAREPVKICRGPVHGDPHAQNIILDSTGRISLIDFGWTGIRWRAVDYIWLECSLKFVVCSPYTQLDDLLYLDDVVDDAWASDRDIDPSCFNDKLHSHSLSKIAGGVCLIRRYAWEQTPLLGLKAYQKGLTIMAYALTTFPQLNRIDLVHSIARQLSRMLPVIRETGPNNRLYNSTDVLWPDRPGRMVRRAVALLKPGRALDLGCGDGKNLVFLEDSGWKVTGVDVSALATAALQRRVRRYYGDNHALRGEIVKRDVVKVDYPSGEYDLVIAYGLYHCLSDEELETVHRGVFRSLKPGGLFAFAIFNDTLLVPDGHQTGDLYMRPSGHIFGLVGTSMEVVDREIGEIEESHPPLVGVHRHGLTWGLFRKR